MDGNDRPDHRPLFRIVVAAAAAALGMFAGFIISIASLAIGERVEAIAGLHFGVPWTEVTMLGYVGIYAPMLGAVAGLLGGLIGRPVAGGAIGAIGAGITDILVFLAMPPRPGSFVFLFAVALLVGIGAGALGGFVRTRIRSSRR